MEQTSNFINQTIQKLRSSSLKTFTEGTFAIESGISPDKAIDIKWGSKNNGANVQQHKKNGSLAQKFEVVFDSNTEYYILGITL